MIDMANGRAVNYALPVRQPLLGLCLRDARCINAHGAQVATEVLRARRIAFKNIQMANSELTQGAGHRAANTASANQ